jgi:serine/threonine protein kinase
MAALYSVSIPSIVSKVPLRKEYTAHPVSIPIVTNKTSEEIKSAPSRVLRPISANVLSTRSKVPICIGKGLSGSYGAIYEFIDPETREKVAVKRHYANNHIDFMACVRELDVLSLLRKRGPHPYIIKLIDVFDSKTKYAGHMLSPVRKYRDDTLHFKFEWASRNLEQYLIQCSGSGTSGSDAAKTILPPLATRFRTPHHIYAQLKSMVMHIFLALEHLHNHNIVHRDLKPTNLLIVENGSPERLVCKLGDFGMCKYTFSQDMETCTGTLYYRSPELAGATAPTPASSGVAAPLWLTEGGGSAITTASDIWSIGCILYEMFARRPLFPARKDSELKVMHTENLAYNRHKLAYRDNIDVKEFNRANGPTWQEMENLIDRCLTYEAKNRITAKEALDLPAFDSYREHINVVRKYYNTDDLINKNLKTPLLVATLVGTSSIPTLVGGDTLLSSVSEKYPRYHYTRKIPNLVNIFRKEQWFRIRSLFMAIDLYDRYSNHVLQRADVAPLLLILAVCLYLSINYAAIDTFNETFTTIASALDPALKQTSKDVAARLSESILSTVAPPGDIYHPGLLEAATLSGDKLSGQEKVDLLSFYANCNSVLGLSAMDLYDIWRKKYKV